MTSPEQTESESDSRGTYNKQVAKQLDRLLVLYRLVDLLHADKLSTEFLQDHRHVPSFDWKQPAPRKRLSHGAHDTVIEGIL